MDSIVLQGMELNTSKRVRATFGKFITIFQVVADYLAIFLSYMASYFFYTKYLKGISPQNFIEFLYISAAVSILYIFLLDRMGLYRREISLLNIKELRGIFRVGLYAAAIVLSISFYIRYTSFSRVTVTTALVGAPIILYFQRMAFYKIHVLFHMKGWSQTRVLIYGAGQIGIHLAKRLFQSPSLGMLPVAFLDDDQSRHGQTVKWAGLGPKNGVPIIGGEDVLNELKRFDISHVMIALPSAKFDRNQQLVEHCVSAQVAYSIVPNSYDQLIQEIEMFEIGGIPILRKRKKRASLVYLIAKRILDFILSLAFILVLSPLYILIGVLIKLDSKGPIIFKQKRVGLKGKEFSFYKFRSMYIDAPQYARTPSDPTDPRITKIGRWLRRTSLDELPQLFNVLRGDMSLVGPRPEMPFIVSQYSAIEKRRLEAKPGITGVWQISAARAEPIHANMEYDLFYLENRSLLLDIAIIIKTIISVVRGIGAI